MPPILAKIPCFVRFAVGMVVLRRLESLKGDVRDGLAGRTERDVEVVYLACGLVVDEAVDEDVGGQVVLVAVDPATPRVGL